MTVAETGKKVVVNFSDEAWEEVEFLAENRELTVSEVVSRALGLEQWLQDLEDLGGRVFVAVARVS